MKRVTAIGFFDGVHPGHAAVIKEAVAMAARLGASPAVVTFDRRPANLLFGEKSALISDHETKCRLIKDMFGIEDIINIPFDRALGDMSAEQFVGEYLIQRFQAVGASVGEDFRFGKGGLGNAELLGRYFPTSAVKTVLLDGAAVSSGRIRTLLERGEVFAANRLLGHPYTLCSEVRHGFGRGHKMDLPTANIALSEEMLRLPTGVYASALTVGSERRMAVTNFGHCPTFGGGDYTVETHIPSFSGDIYGEKIKLEILGEIRPEMRFPSAEALVAQTALDIEKAREIFERSVYTL